jgi:hypothetical protein
MDSEDDDQYDPFQNNIDVMLQMIEDDIPRLEPTRWAPTHRRGRARMPRDANIRRIPRLIHAAITPSPAERAFITEHNLETQVTNNELENSLMRRIENTTQRILRHQRLYRNSFTGDLRRLRNMRHDLRNRLVQLRNGF